MRKKFVTAIFALIGLGSFVVLGNTRGFSTKLIDSINNIQGLAKFLAPETSNHHKASLIVSSIAETENNVSGSAEIPDYFLYDKFLRITQKLKNLSDSTPPPDPRGVGLRNYFSRQIGLTDEENVLVGDLAAEYERELAPINAEANLIITKTRDEYKGKKWQDNPPPPELVELQNQKNDLALRYRDRLKENLGDETFAKIDRFITNEFASRFQVISLADINFEQQ